MFATRLKQELQALREELSSIEQVRTSLDEEMLALYLDAQGRIDSVNANFEKEMLYRADQLRGRPLLALIPEHVRNLDFHHRVRHALERGEHLAGVIRLKRGNGEEAWLRSILQPLRDSQGKVQRFSIYASDLTRTIETSREHENLISALQRSTAVIEFNLNGEVLTANQRFLDSMGYSLTQIQGKHHRIFAMPPKPILHNTSGSGSNCAVANSPQVASDAWTVTDAKSGWKPPTTPSPTPTTTCIRWSSSPR